MKKAFEILLGAVLLGSFFTPWSKFFGLKGSGLDLAKSPQIDGVFLYVVPALAALFLVFKIAFSNKSRGMQLLTGLVPMLSFIGGLVYIGQKTESNLLDAFSNVRGFIDWGVYLALGAGLLLFISALFKPKNHDQV